MTDPPSFLCPECRKSTAGRCGQHGTFVYSTMPVPLPRQPYGCPVCAGRGTVPAGFYNYGVTSTTGPEPCRACAGTGIVWSEESVRTRPAPGEDVV